MQRIPVGIFDWLRSAVLLLALRCVFLRYYGFALSCTKINLVIVWARQTDSHNGDVRNEFLGSGTTQAEFCVRFLKQDSSVKQNGF